MLRRKQRDFSFQLATVYSVLDVELVPVVRRSVIVVRVFNFVVPLLWSIPLVIAVSLVAQQVIAAHPMASMYRSVRSQNRL